MINNDRGLKLWCQKVLPLVYDDSLSYYELLCKVVKWIENVIGDVNAVADENKKLWEAYEQLKKYVDNYFDTFDYKEEINKYMDELLEQGVLEEWAEKYFKNTTYYSILNYGGKNDGVTDNQQPTQDLLNELNGRGGTIYFPAGEYIFEKPIIIPDSVSLVGDGFGTKLLFKNVNHYNMRCGMAICGNYVRVDNIRVETEGGDTATWSSFDTENSAIGVRTYDYDSVMAGINIDDVPDLSVRETRRGVVLNNIYSYSKLPITFISTESESTITQCDITNVIIPDGAIYIYSDGNDKINRCTMSNCDVGFINVPMTYRSRLLIDNSFFNAGVLMNEGIKVSNCEFWYYQNNTTEKYGYVTDVMQCRSVEFSNCRFTVDTVISNVNGVDVRGSGSGLSETFSLFNNCTFTHGNSACKSLRSSTSTKAFLTGCIVYNKSLIRGNFSATYFNDNDGEDVSFSSLSGFARFNGTGGWWQSVEGIPYSTQIKVKGNKVQMRFAYYKNNFTYTEKTKIPILQVNDAFARPSTYKTGNCYIYDALNNVTRTGIFKYDTDGIFYVLSEDGTYPSNMIVFMDTEIPLTTY